MLTGLVPKAERTKQLTLSPAVAMAMAVALICMIYSTAVGMFFSFTARFATPETTRFKVLSVLFTGVGLVLSQFGFSALIGTVYPMLGVVGLILTLALGYRWQTARRAARLRLASSSYFDS